jgi:PAS domain S-box-containing protein
MPSQTASAITPDASLEILRAVNATRTAVWRHSRHSALIEVNPTGLALVGIEGPQEVIAAAAWRARLHPDDLPAVLAATRRCLRSRQTVDFQARYRHQDGGWRHLLTRCATLLSSSGQVLALAGSTIDITVQLEKARRAEAATRRFERVTRSAGIGYWTFSTGDEVAFWSQPLRELYGLLPNEEPPSQRVWLDKFVHADDRQALVAKLAQWHSDANSSAEATVTHRIVRRDGSIRHLLSHARRDGSAHGEDTYGVAIDLTERRLTELKLQSVAAKAALAAHAIGMGAWEVDLETGEATWDEQMFALRCLPPRPGPLNAAERLALVHPDDRERVSKINAQAQSLHSPLELEFRITWPDGSVHWLASRSMELAVDPDGKRRRIGVNWDITDKIQTQHTLQLREAALQEAQAREHAKTQLLSRMSHELRTPLNAVLGFTQLLLLAEQNDTDARAEQRQRWLMHIDSAGNQLLGLINNALELSSLGDDHTPSISASTANTADRREVKTAAEAVDTRCVLYIEDNPVNALIVKELLSRRQGVQLQIAVDGASGIQQALQIKPDLILIDMQLPDMDGLEVLRGLRAQPALAHVTCIALSANAVQEDIQRALNAGMADYWTKPLDFNVFLAALDKLFLKPRVPLNGP